VARTRLTKRRLVGLDRSGPPPPETERGQPLRPWTLPNAIGFVRLAAIPVFLVIAFNDGDGRSTAAGAVFLGIAWADQLDGVAARLTGQYSRLGALMDPLTDRLLILSGAAVAFHYELLPRWALLALAARELFMVVLTQVALRRGMDLQVNMTGRWAVWPLMFALPLSLVADTWVADAALYLGLGMTLWATAEYVRDGLRFLEAERPSSST
jgi:CDP-diacylglycerol--glycerol-3-phosphate 3-phosphatidyltransferase